MQIQNFFSVPSREITQPRSLSAVEPYDNYKFMKLERVEKSTEKIDRIEKI
jgi:hypothetical protein